ncbi:MAG: sporulation protein YqfD [Clostridia bacterium]|nr:sporulation protein YqfD [Clostridia bacterium]
MKLLDIRFLWSKRLILPVQHVAKILNYAREKHIKIRIYHQADNKTPVQISYNGWRALCEHFPFLLETESEDRGCVPFFIQQRQRAGLLLGGVLAMLLFSFLGGRVWDVRISGNTYLSDAQILQELENAGFGEGAALSSLDTKAIAGDVLLASQDLSFVGINMRGTVAYVHVVERMQQEEEDSSVQGSNLVAKTDAVIDTLSVKRGTIAVHRGQVVREGELLVSGITEGSDGSKLVRAEGEVFGRVSRRFEIVLPRNSTVRQTKQAQICSFSLVFWGKNINIYTNTGNLPPTYDTIYEIEQLYLGDNVRLPFGFARAVAVSYEEETTMLSDKELVDLAYARLEAELCLALKDGELLCKKIYGSFTEDSYTLICEAECLENIAKTVEFDAR